MPKASTVKKKRRRRSGIVILRHVSIQEEPSLNVGQKSGYPEDFSRFLQENFKEEP
jgi:hypothetical protein